MEQLFAADVVSYADGGGAVRASRCPVRGRTHVAKFVRAFAPRFWTDVDLAWVEANGQGSGLVSRAGVAFAFVTVSASAQGIAQLLWVLNPPKLAGITLSLAG